MSNVAKHIALFGGSFDPPHLGHVAVIQGLLKEKTFDEVWLVPVFQHPFAKTLSPFENRKHMLELVLGTIQNPNLKICTIEKELASHTSYFYDTLLALKQKHPAHHFHIVVGSDVKATLHKWHRIEDLKREAEFYFIPRQGFEASPYPEVSSTELRTNIKSQQSIDEQVLPKIKDYIAKAKLYS